MRRGMAVLVGCLVMALTAHAGEGRQPGGAGGGRGSLPIPETLDSLYPPISDRPVYLLEMLELETSFSGILVDLMENDLEGARGSFEDFQRRYRKVAGLVPEWVGEYPEGQVKQLGAALAAGDKRQTMNSFAAVGEICHRCHVSSMVPVQQRFHWGDFGSVTVQDPPSGETAGYPQFKKFLSANLAGITVNLRQGQAGNARKQYEGFRARFEALRGSCRDCHEQESRYFVDREIQDTVEALGRIFAEEPVRVDAASSLVQKIGRESCSKCHLVHLPAAMARMIRR